MNKKQVKRGLLGAVIVAELAVHVFQIEYWWQGQMIVSTVGHKSPDLEESFVSAAEDNDVKINFI